MPLAWLYNTPPPQASKQCKEQESHTMGVADSDSGVGGNIFEGFKVCANYIITIATGYSRHVGGTGAY